MLGAMASETTAKPPRKRGAFLAQLLEHATPAEYILYRFRFLLAFVVFIISTFVTFPRSHKYEWENRSSVQSLHALGLALYSYAQDHDLHYPDGKTSTEVFQKLVDGDYVTDPAIFYLPMKGKTPAKDKVIKPENVCFDYTQGVQVAQPDDGGYIPLIFTTGSHLDYSTGKVSSLSEDSPYGTDGIAVFYANIRANFVLAADFADKFFGPGYDPKGKNYIQLMP